jgi:DNA-directed RNA polymerase omega subunit
MPSPYCVDDFSSKVDSLYRLVILSARRANQISKTESHSFGPVARAKKPIISALEEVLAGKVSYFTSKEEDEGYLD